MNWYVKEGLFFRAKNAGLNFRPKEPECSIFLCGHTDSLGWITAYTAISPYETTGLSFISLSVSALVRRSSHCVSCR